jgi:tetratricopeptide (TPR) repeat protein
MQSPPRTGRQLLDLAAPLIATHDLAGFEIALRRDWPAERLGQFVQSGTPFVARVAVLGLGLIGDMSVCPVLSAALYHTDPRVAHSAEQALWYIWFRDAGPSAQQALYPIVRRLKHQDDAGTIEELTHLLARHNRYAEAYDQRGIAFCLAGRWGDACRDFARALFLNPYHFAAQAGLGHCHARLGRLDKAISCYRAARQLHPRLEGVRQAIRRLREAMSQRPCLAEPEEFEESSGVVGSIVRK